MFYTQRKKNNPSIYLAIHRMPPTPTHPPTPRPTPTPTPISTFIDFKSAGPLEPI